MFRKYNIPFALDAPETSLAHRDIILRKPYLKRLYNDWYNVFSERLIGAHTGRHLEIGSGGGFLKEIFPEVITSDILNLPNVDMVLSAENLPFENSELASIMMLNTFHHIANPHLFLLEAERTLIPGGKIIMIEPANSLFGRFVYKHFHHEPFDEHGARQIKSGNPLSNSNQALPYIYFERDLEQFEKDYPLLRINSVHYHTPFSYIISGGVSRSAMLPYFMYNLIKAAEWLLTPLSKQLGLFCTIKVDKANH